MAHANWDCLTVDMQHGLHSMETAMQMMQAIATTEVIPLARSNWNNPGQIMRLLDAGAYGIICPMINTKKECEDFVGAYLYPQLGYRSKGPTRAAIYGGSDYTENANEQLLILAMVETLEAVHHIDAICSVEGLDGIFIGSGDLKVSIDACQKKQITYAEAIQKTQNACKKYDLHAGIWCASLEDAKEMIKQGFWFIALKSDGKILMEYAKKESKEIKK